MTPTSTAEPLVVEVVRSGSCESTHLIDVAVVDASGELVAWAGDPGRMAAFRSSSKPMQARASQDAGWEPASDRALAIACASHNGEPGHIEAVRELLADGGVDEAMLRCPADVPMYQPAALAVQERTPVYHNCSGKHAAMLAACLVAGWSLESYRADDHPLQRATRALIESLVGPVIGPLVDGCGVPTFVAPLRALARGLLAMDGGVESIAMRAHPFLVAGSARLDTDLMEAVPEVLIKSGAEGLACLSVAGLGIALKSRDGAARPRGPAVLLVLEQLELISAASLEALIAHREPAVLGGGEPVGVARARGSVRRA
jgi:L-asparaginase II